MRSPALRSFAFALVLLTPLVVGLAAALELVKVTRLATDRAAIESNLVSNMVRRQLDIVARQNPGATLAELAADPRIQLVLDDAIENAPTILHVAVCDTNGVIVAHSVPSRVGERVSRRSELPSAAGVAEALQVMWHLGRRGETYENFVPLTVGDRPFASVQVVVSAGFLRDGVRGAFWTGTAVTLFVLVVTLSAGIVLTRFVLRGLRSLEERVVAMREGRLPARAAASGRNEFGRLSHELDLLEQQFRNSSHDALAKSRILERLAEMATGVAHEIRNPLQMLSFQLSELETATRDETLHGSIRDAQRTMARMERAVRGFLAVARVRPLSIEPLDLDALLRESREELETEANLAGLELELELGAGASPCVLAGDAGVLRQALENLVRNAIRAQPSRDGRIVLRCSREGSSLCVSVEDTGPGIPAQFLERVFDPFFTTREDGTGVGLTLVRQAVEMHGGEVRVTSSPGRGTVVTADLPAAEDDGMRGDP